MYCFARRRDAAARHEHGFTMIEMIIAVLIIGILAAVSIPAYLQSIERAEEKEAITILNIIHHAQKMYYYDYKDRFSHDPSLLSYAPDIVTLQDYEDIPDSDAHWDYFISSAGADTFEATATPNDTSAYNRTVAIDETGAISYP